MTDHHSPPVTGRFSALLFDLDGTLVDSAPDISAAINRVLERMGRPLLGVSDIQSLIHLPAPVLVEKALALTGPAARQQDIDFLLSEFLEGYRRNPGQHTVLFPGAREALERYMAAGIRLGLCTNKPEITCFPVLETLDLRRYFTAIVCGDTLDYHKPDPRHVLHTLDILGAAPRDAAFIGDTEVDMQAARNAGLPSICVTFGYAQTPCDTLGADGLIDHFDELDETLRAIGERQTTPAPQ